jgi:predicted RNA binding protein YcfA (HicA-like mRNA interferase family)
MDGNRPESSPLCHHVYTKPGNPARISLPIHGNQSLKIGLLKHLMALADIDETEL